MPDKSYIGIDPGKKGGMALISDSEIKVFEKVDDFTLVKDELVYWKINNNIEVACLERVHAFPGEGACSSFSFGTNYGCWQGLFIALNIPFITVPPKTWQVVVDKSLHQNIKKASLMTARRMFPEVDLSKEKHSGIADALLIAYYNKNISKINK